VRDEAARQKLRTDIGPVGIILYVRAIFALHWSLTVTSFRTLFNSKGLEYDDVSSMRCANLRNTI